MPIIFIQCTSAWSSYFTGSLTKFLSHFEDECFQIDIRLTSEIVKKNLYECPSIKNAFNEYDVDKCTDVADMDIRLEKFPLKSCSSVMQHKCNYSTT